MWDQSMDAFSWYAAETNHPSKNCMNKAVPLCSLTNLQLRFLCPTDLPEVRALCQDWFPIDYPYTWYEDITSNPRFYSLAAVYEGIIIGLIVAEIKSYFKLNREDKDILAASFGKSCCVGYILSLGVSEKHRRNGIASLLLENLVSHLTAPENSHCKAIFLHVLTVNSVAIHFYEHRHFRLHSFLPYYYSINGKSKDGFTYVLYINGGHSPWGIYDYVKYGCGLLYQLDLCAWVTARLRGALAWIWPGMRRIVVENTTALITH
uniref:N-alpha-acetyltransferase 60 n=2 Tax=Proconiini TaxID=565685 RepID=A0A1B6GW07_9HEMI